MTPLEYAYSGLLIVFCAAGSLSDLASRRIPNLLCLACGVCGLGLAVAAGGWLPYALHMGVALVIGMGLFALRAVGGGDAKFYAGLATFFPLESALRLGVSIAVSGGLLALAFLAIGRLRRDPKRSVKSRELPYGVAIAAGSLVCAFA